jgi:hypothetical protein
MTKIAFQGYIYESLNEKELKFIHGKMQQAVENFDAVLNIVHDGNQKKAMSSLMNKTLDTFNEKIKGTDYAPKSLDDMEQQSKEIDGALKEQQLADENSSSETAPEQRDSSEEQYA